MLIRLEGGVPITLKSLSPNNDICNVLGMGVAERENKWIWGYLLTKNSFWSTPNFCSSSITNVPRLLNSISFLKRLWVAMRIWISPFFNPSKISFFSFKDVNRDSVATVVSKDEKRKSKVLLCWRARSVVGTPMTNWYPDRYVAQAILKATSVLPKPTSPQINRLAGFSEIKSKSEFSIAFNWSSVSINSNFSLNLSRSVWE